MSRDAFPDVVRSYWTWPRIRMKRNVASWGSRPINETTINAAYVLKTLQTSKSVIVVRTPFYLVEYRSIWSSNIGTNSAQWYLCRYLRIWWTRWYTESRSVSLGDTDCKLKVQRRKLSSDILVMMLEELEERVYYNLHVLHNSSAQSCVCRHVEEKCMAD